MTQQFSPPYEVVEMSRRIFENLISSTLKTSDTTVDLPLYFQTPVIT